MSGLNTFLTYVSTTRTSTLLLFILRDRAPPLLDRIHRATGISLSRALKLQDSYAIPLSQQCAHPQQYLTRVSGRPPQPGAHIYSPKLSLKRSSNTCFSHSTTRTTLALSLFKTSTNRAPTGNHFMTLQTSCLFLVQLHFLQNLRVRKVLVRLATLHMVKK